MKSTINPPQGLTAQAGQTSLPKAFFSSSQSILLKEGIEDLMDGTLVLTDQKEILYANDSARRVLQKLNQGQSLIELVPREIWHICQSLIHSRNLFPEQQWLIESEVFTDSFVAFHIRVRWLKLESVEHPCYY